jgi:predicted Zn-dependent protease
MDSTARAARRAAWILPALLLGCATVPLTGRSQLMLVSSGEMNALAAREYGAFLKENPPSKDARAAETVRRVGSRIQKAVEEYLGARGLSSRLEGYRWEFNLVESKEVNAWCMPGGKVVVYSGILPVAEDEAGLAVVMGHEIAHAIAEHGAERMSQQMVAEAGGAALSVLLAERPAETRDLWLGAYGIGTQVGVLLPFSRDQEGEADRLGLAFMAMAGYDPRAAVGFWRRMAATAGGKGPPAFLSTHPADDARVAALEREMPEALRYYRPAG